MIFAIPIYIEEHPSGSAKLPTYIVRPLLRVEPLERAEKLTRALTKLSSALHELLHDLGDQPRHDELAWWTFNPTFEVATLKLRLELSSGSHRRGFFFVGYRALDRRLYFTPKLPDLHFEVLPDEDLEARATAVLTRHFREMERNEGFIDLDHYALTGKGRLTTLEVTLIPASSAIKRREPARAALFGGGEQMDGEAELRKTGRCLNRMYPDDLDRALNREREVEELTRLLGSTDRRPVLLVGPRRVGKTTVLHEVVWQKSARVVRAETSSNGQGDVWLVSPMRLISGMSYLGEWENRVLAILEHAKELDRVLYFDDLLGLFTAGVSSASDLNVAQVLRPWLEERSVRIIAEITPEAWRVLREKDRSFADLFHVMPVNEPPAPEVLRILINVVRHLEEAHGCAFDMEIVPTVYELHRRYATDAAFPGKAAGFLHRLAIRFSGDTVTRLQALSEFHQQTGLQVAMLDDSTRLERKSILSQLRNSVVGQDHALEAFADILLTLKARLNDPRRPLGSMLLLGPTGVGKTHAAKALAELLFGGGERLLRFDMNEYVDSTSVSRLTGSPRDPEGLLTSAVRRQPFSVVLFDEIEKATPEIFDLLLAVIDEGRLTDSLGRVADFTQTVILLSSNLGAREARSRLGYGAFATGAEADDAIYVSAAEKFFRPEFFNRLDRIIPFRSLDSTHLEGISQQLIGSLLSRDGLRRRDALLSVTPSATKRLAELGYHPQLGARALKRVVESDVAQPLAELLVALPPGAPMLTQITTKGAGLTVSMKDLRPVARSVLWPESLNKARTAPAQADWRAKVLAGVYKALERIDSELEADAPTGTIEVGKLPPEHLRYFLCCEHLRTIESLISSVDQIAPPPTKDPSRLPRPKPVHGAVKRPASTSLSLGCLRDAMSVEHDILDLEADEVGFLDSALAALLREMALLEALAQKPTNMESALLVFRTFLPSDNGLMATIAQSYFDCLSSIWGASSCAFLTRLGKDTKTLTAASTEHQGGILALFLTGIRIRSVLPHAQNVILTRSASGRAGAILMSLEIMSNKAEARARVKKLGSSPDALDLESLGPVIQRIVENATLTDFRTGVVAPARPSLEEFRALLLSALPLTPELAQPMED